MSGLEIPDAARDEFFTCGCHDPKCDRAGYSEEALPLVVAAELRRLADLDGPFAFDHDAAAKLRARADELDPR